MTPRVFTPTYPVTPRPPHTDLPGASPPRHVCLPGGSPRPSPLTYPVGSRRATTKSNHPPRSPTRCFPPRRAHLSGASPPRHAHLPGVHPKPSPQPTRWLPAIPPPAYPVDSHRLVQQSPRLLARCLLTSSRLLTRWLPTTPPPAYPVDSRRATTKSNHPSSSKTLTKAYPVAPRLVTLTYPVAPHDPHAYLPGASPRSSRLLTRWLLASSRLPTR